jgi:DNA-binding NarL/FixJ family response regulator
MPKIMIVDDDVSIRMELEEFLIHMDYTVVGIADTGAGAVEMARAMKPDLILMDVKMPGEMDGISAARKIKEEMDVAVVFITGFGDPETIERAKRVEPSAM